MVLFGGALGVLALGVWIFCIIDVLTTPGDQVRNLPKLAWVLIVILFVEIGAIIWLVAGRPWGATRAAGAPGNTFGGFGPRRPAGRMSTPDDDEEFLASLSKRAEEQRRRARDESGTATDDPPAGTAPSA